MNEIPEDDITHWNWEATFWDEYTANTPEDDIHFLVEEAQKFGSPVLEIGCGTGRSLIPVARSGLNIVGLDLSPKMLAQAREKISRLDDAVQARIELVEGDIREFSLGRQFALVTITYVFFFLKTPSDQQKALHCIHAHLMSGGHLILFNVDPKPEVIAAQLGPFGTSLQKTAEFVEQTTGHRVIIWRARDINLEQQLTNTTEIHEELDTEGKVIQRTHKTLTSRFTYRYELQYLLELCGYKVDALYGDFKRGPFRPGGLQIWVARKV